MISVSPKHRIYLAIQPLDFRKGINGISRYCENQYKLDPMTGHYFIFRNKRKTDLKILYYDSQGFCLFQKRLSAGKFNNWPMVDSDLVTLTPAQAQVLINNGDPIKTIISEPWKSITDES